MAKQRVDIVIAAKDQATGKLKRVGKAMGSLGGGMGIVKLAAGFHLAQQAVGTFVSVGRGVLDTFEAQEAAERKLGAVLKATGGAVGLSQAALEDYAGELQKTTTYGDEAIINTQAILATFKQVKGDEFKRATASILDMSAVLGQDAKQGAIQLGKALNDPIRGITALARVGVTFSRAQKEQIANFAEANDLAAAQAVILDELESEFGGAAKAMAETFGGQLTQVFNSLGDSVELLGGAFASMFGGADKSGRTFLQTLRDNIDALNEMVEINAELEAKQRARGGGGPGNEYAQMIRDGGTKIGKALAWVGATLADARDYVLIGKTQAQFRRELQFQREFEEARERELKGLWDQVKQTAGITGQAGRWAEELFSARGDVATAFKDLSGEMGKDEADIAKRLREAAQGIANATGTERERIRKALQGLADDLETIGETTLAGQIRHADRLSGARDSEVEIYGLMATSIKDNRDVVYGVMKQLDAAAASLAPDDRGAKGLKALSESMLSIQAWTRGPNADKELHPKLWSAFQQAADNLGEVLADMPPEARRRILAQLEPASGREDLFTELFATFRARLGRAGRARDVEKAAGARLAAAARETALSRERAKISERLEGGRLAALKLEASLGDKRAQLLAKILGTERSISTLRQAAERISYGKTGTEGQQDRAFRQSMDLRETEQRALKRSVGQVVKSEAVAARLVKSLQKIDRAYDGRIEWLRKNLADEKLGAEHRRAWQTELTRREKDRADAYRKRIGAAMAEDKTIQERKALAETLAGVEKSILAGRAEAGDREAELEQRRQEIEADTAANRKKLTDLLADEAATEAQKARARKALEGLDPTAAARIAAARKEILAPETTGARAAVGAFESRFLKYAPGQDVARQTADNTRKLTRLADKTNRIAAQQKTALDTLVGLVRNPGTILEVVGLN